MNNNNNDTNGLDGFTEMLVEDDNGKSAPVYPDVRIFKKGNRRLIEVFANDDMETAKVNEKGNVVYLNTGGGGRNFKVNPQGDMVKINFTIMSTKPKTRTIEEQKRLYKDIEVRETPVKEKQSISLFQF